MSDPVGTLARRFVVGRFGKLGTLDIFMCMRIWASELVAIRLAREWNGQRVGSRKVIGERELRVKGWIFLL